MIILLKKATVLDSESPFNKEQVDVLIKEGKIAEIGANLNTIDAKTISGKDLCISQSWVDLKADFCDPGNEYDEDLKSGLTLAAGSGFGHVFIVPTTFPPIDNKGQVNSLKKESEHFVTELYPMGAITQQLEGEKLAELYDMYQNGVRLFTDNTYSLSAGILLRALMYSKDFGGKIISFPQEASIHQNGQINEGTASLKTGLKAIPAIGEQIRVQRDLSILEYAGGSLHFSGISTASSIALIREAKNKGLNVTCDVYANHLLFIENDVLSFDTNHKVYPPYRTEKDKEALWNGLKDDTIDCIVSNHTPRIVDKKDIEFDNAEFGCSSMQTVFSSLYQENKIELSVLIHKLSNSPRKIGKIEKDNSIKVGNTADITIFDITKRWKLTDATNLSKSKNSPFYNKELLGQAYGVIKGKLCYFNSFKN